MYYTPGKKGRLNMSAGNQVVTFRLPPELIEEMRLAIASRNERTADAPWTWSDYIRSCVTSDLAHRQRGRQGSQERKSNRMAAMAAQDQETGQGGVL